MVTKIHNKQRPNPDLLLAQFQKQEKKTKRGKLRIYFGASAGVGKTYAMLSEAHQLIKSGKNVLIGVIETHGRHETAALLEGLEIAPLKSFEHRDKILYEFDIDSALARKPELIVIDELAHSNVTGSRHPKRWQDVNELLQEGIDVFTTLNVQHLESLNDVVGGITGIFVSETLPDSVFDDADEIVLVDVPADELLARLKSGRIYPIQQAQRAAQNFFRKGNLIALRELALRRTADRVEGDVRAYREEKFIKNIWKTDPAFLALIENPEDADGIVRGAARLSKQMNAEWHMIYIETPQFHKIAIQDRERILENLKMAQDLGAKTAVLMGDDVASTMIDYAKTHNLSRIVLGKQASSTLFRWNLTLSQKIRQHDSSIDLIELGSQENSVDLNKKIFSIFNLKWRADTDKDKKHQLQYAYAFFASIATAIIATPLLSFFNLVNIAMLFLLTVVLVAARLGKGPSVLATITSVLAFDFFFVPPRFSFAVSDFQYVVTFLVMLIVGLITGHLTSGLRYQAKVASQREKRAFALYEFARDLSGFLQSEQITEAIHKIIGNTFHAKAVLLLPGENGTLVKPDVQNEGLDMGIAQWAFDKIEVAGLSTNTLPANPYLYLPLVAPMLTRGVLAISPTHPQWILIPEQRQQLHTFATLTAIALERVHYTEVAQQALIQMESERLRNSLLAALSHDLRTPLTSIVCISDALNNDDNKLSEYLKGMIQLLQNEAMRMSALVINLLDMAKIQSGNAKLNLQWQAIEDVIGSAIRMSASQLNHHQVKVELAPNLPLVQFDAILIERVLCNLLENSAKYAQQDTQITIKVEIHGENIKVMVCDNGQGFPIGKEKVIFEKFTRGDPESSKPGVGLGLAICQSIIEAHHGWIVAKNILNGACVEFTLPLGSPPLIPETSALLS